MSNNSDRHRRVPRRGADIRAELSARELEREFPHVGTIADYFPVFPVSPDGYYGFAEPNL
jgi:hypothetical protein